MVPISQVLEKSWIMKQRFFVLACMLAASSCFAPSARAWGCKGHQTVALIAEKHLTTEARQLVDKLLGENPIEPKLKRGCGNTTPDFMVDASTWPDDVRNERHNGPRSEEHTSELQSPCNLVCRLLLEKKKNHHRNLRDRLP